MRENVAQVLALVVAALVPMVMLVNTVQAAPTECADGLCDDKLAASDEAFSDGTDLGKRMSKFVRIGKGHGSSFVRIGRPHSFVRIGKSTGLESEYEEPAKRGGSNFLRIGKGMNRFLRIGKSVDSDKRASRFLRIGKSMEDEDEEMDKRGHAFVRIGKIPSSAFVRIGREPLLDRIMKKPSSSFLRIGRMGQSSFVRIGKKSSGSDEDTYSV
ncbi:FMRFamide-related peptides type HF-1-like [Haliotis cracherodii]|uniref:FMRFamide-related peptides type HF-1-like n=1 Tax=Haliotis cracherodii TaxID=6455 RepID=UPI0039E7A060